MEDCYVANNQSDNQTTRLSNYLILKQYELHIMKTGKKQYIAGHIGIKLRTAGYDH